MTSVAVENASAIVGVAPAYTPCKLEAIPYNYLNDNSLNAAPRSIQVTVR